MQHRLAVQEFHDWRFDCGRSVVSYYGCRGDHVASVIEDNRYCGLTQRVERGKSVGATPTLHPADCDWSAGAEGQNLGADQIEVAHAVKVFVICNTGCAIAGAELRTNVDF